LLPLAAAHGGFVRQLALHPLYELPAAVYLAFMSELFWLLNTFSL
jgi:hypothetical protein